MKRKADRPFLITTVILIAVGFFIFTSASLGLLAGEGARFSQVAFSQIVFGIILGSIALAIFSSINYRFWKKYAVYIFLFSIAVTLLVFVPGIGLELGGAKRWISFGLLPSFQPAELLKLGFVMYFAAWLSGIRDKIHTFSYGIVPFVVFLVIIAAVLLTQPDTGTFLIIFAAALGMFIAGGGRWRDIVILASLSFVSVILLAFTRPYIKDRLLSFIDPSLDPLGAGYQIQQSLIAVGSGQIFGRGFGQSIQKFNFLPEPISDSIFSVAAEEFGFIGAVILIALFIVLAIRGLKIAERAPDYFGGLLTVGIVILIVSQSFINIASMLGVLPLTGVPLLFVSHGGSALLFTLAEIGIVLNVSRYYRK